MCQEHGLIRIVDAHRRNISSHDMYDKLDSTMELVVCDSELPVPSANPNSVRAELPEELYTTQ